MQRFYPCSIWVRFRKSDGRATGCQTVRAWAKFAFGSLKLLKATISPNSELKMNFNNSLVIIFGMSTLVYKCLINRSDFGQITLSFWFNLGIRKESFQTPKFRSERNGRLSSLTGKEYAFHCNSIHFFLPFSAVSSYFLWYCFLLKLSALTGFIRGSSSPNVRPHRSPCEEAGCKQTDRKIHETKKKTIRLLVSMV